MRIFIASFVVTISCRSDKIFFADSDIQNILVDADADGYDESEDCDDSNVATHPGAGEICDGLDNDCDGEVDEGVASLVYPDSDGDGFGDENMPTEACEMLPGYVSNGSDCDDSNANVFPGNLEVCDGIDNDCNERIDDEDQNLDLNDSGIFYVDADGDGYGDAATEIRACEAGDSWVNNHDDCDDTSAEIHPAANEICDGLDNDCDDWIDDEDPSVDDSSVQVFYLDSDGDGFGEDESEFLFCGDPGLGYVQENGDCEDTQDYTYPGAAYMEGSDCLSDYDGDGYAPLLQGGNDCDDTDASTYPGGSDDVGDGMDQNCDGIDGADGDGDGLASFESGGNDCDDTDATLSENCPPEWGVVEITGAAYASEDLTCEATAIDGDGDAISYEYRWLKGSVEIATTQVLPGGSLVLNDVVECCATASDGFHQSSEHCSDSLEIENQPPSVDSVELAPALLYTNDTVFASVVLSDEDASQSVSATYAWHVIDATTGINSEVQNSAAAALSGVSHFNKADAVYVIVTPNDGLDDGSPYASDMTIVANSIPSAPSISIDPDPAVEGQDDLICFVDTASIDDDGDSVVYTYVWTNPDGVVQQTTTETLATSDTVLASLTSAGVWTCTVYPSDGDDVGASVSISTTVEASCPPDGDGSSVACPAESCYSIYQNGYATQDGTYWLQDTDGMVSDYYCDMANGGWTRLVYWNRDANGDTKADFESAFTVYNTLDAYTEESTHLKWCDLNDSGDVFDANHTVKIINNGSLRYDTQVKTFNTNGSAIWLYSKDSGNAMQNILCHDDRIDAHTWRYSNSELSYIPYNCSSSLSDTWDQDIDGTVTHGAEITDVYFTTLRHNSHCGDRLELWKIYIFVQ